MSKVRALFVCIILALTIAVIPSPSVFAATNLVLNPGFEEADSNDVFYWSTWSWQEEGKTSLDTSMSHSGTSSILITNEQATDTRYKQTIKAKANTYYKLSCWAKTENVGVENKGANLSIEYLTVSTADLWDTNEWTYLEMYGVTGDDQDSFTITLGLGGYSSTNTGKAWFDDVVVEELETVPEAVTLVKLYSDQDIAGNGSGVAPTSGLNPVFLAFIVLSAIIICALIYFVLVRKPQVSRKTLGSTADSTTGPGAGAGAGPGAGASAAPHHKRNRKDYIIMAVMTGIYLIIALLNLGSLKAPQTYWTPSEAGESITLDLGKEVSLSRFYYYGGIDQTRPITGKYRIQYALDSQASGVPVEFTHLATLTKEERDIYTWNYTALPDMKVRYLKIIVDTPGGTLNELAFFEKGSTEPYTDFSIIERTGVLGASNDGSITADSTIADSTIPESTSDTDSIVAVSTVPENLFDESDTVDYYHTYLSGMIFDEIYHARTAYEHLHSMPVYEWTHPPLGKILISLGILVFGMVPFGWRIVGTLVGAAMIPLMYLFGLKLFKKRFYAFCSAFLMMFDFMHFGLTRIATIDVYGTFFIILMYYFMYDYFVNKSYDLGFKPSLKPLFLSGLFFGIGAACKWIGVYAGGGLAFLFFLSKYLEYMDYRRYSSNTLSGEKTNGSNKTTSSSMVKPSWLKDFFPVYIVKTCLSCVVFFVIIPIITYALSYIPYYLVPGYGNDTGLIWRFQQGMFKYHAFDVLGSTHPFSSTWWQWPLMWRPLETYLGSDLPQGMSSTMTIIGNPAIWWVGIIAVVIAFIIAFKRKDKSMVVIFAAMAFQYLPWVGVTRIVFIYHFFSVVPFMILSIVYCIKALLDAYPEARYIVGAYLTLVLILFVMFYPVLSGMEVSRGYVENYLLWFKEKWIF